MPPVVQRDVPCSSVARDLDDFEFGAGSLDDYDSLAWSHYRAGRPITATRVFTIHHIRPTVVGRFLGHENERTLVGVLVESHPPLMCALRDVATNGRYRGLRLHEKAAVLNREMRTITRVIIDPRYRGLGLAVRLVRHALDRPVTIYTEALAVMGRVNPFFERAGMTRYDRPHHPAHARLLDALDEVRLNPCDLASPRCVRDRLEAVSEGRRIWFDVELRRWAKASRLVIGSRATSQRDEELIALARDHLLVNPVYYLHRAVSGTAS